MSSSERVRVVQYGLGPIGLMAVKSILVRKDLELVGAIDMDPKKLERDVADLSGLRRPSGIRVSNRPEEVLAVQRPQVVLHATPSRLADVISQLKQCLEVGASLISTCEELLLPFESNPEPARELDLLARSKRAVILGTGVNPGFALDILALVATAPCLALSSVRVDRVVDASRFGEALQRKLGAGMSGSEFRRGVRKGSVGHRGLRESLHLVARGLGWKLDRVTEKVTPILADRHVKTRYLSVKKGEVAGAHHVCRGFRNGKEALHLNFQTVVGARKPVESITIKGKPALNLVVHGGVAGEETTVGMMLNLISSLLAAPPGLRTMLEIPLPRFRAWD